MDAREILDANVEIKEGSFLHYLQNKQVFVSVVGSLCLRSKSAHGTIG